MNQPRAAPPPPISNSFWIEPGRLLGGEHPGGTSAQATEQRLQALLDAGVTYFLDLTQHHEMPGYAQALSAMHKSERVVHRNLPLVDHGLPSSPTVLLNILDDLDAAIAAGHCVYVHCRAGIGRTNLVAGCWLRRQGMSGKSALKHLNQLWKANARSASWPRVPEAHQEKYVLNFDPDYTGVDTSTSRLGIQERDRYLGAVLGLACGDAQGAARVERGHSDQVWTDDTSMMLCLAESLVETGGFDAADQLARYVRWQREGHLSSQGVALGLTPLVSKALATASWSGKVFAGSHDPTVSDPQALSRVGAVALFSAKHEAEAIAWAAECTRITHQAPGILDASRYLAALVISALNGAPKSRLLTDAARALAKGYGKPLKAPVAALAQGFQFPPTPSLPSKHGASGVLQRVLWALGQTNDFHQGLGAAIRETEYPDVTGAVFGLLAGALYGVDSIPQRWRSGLAQTDMLAGMAERLLAAASSRL